MKQGRPTLLSLLLVLLLILLGAHSSLTSKQDGSNYLEKGRWDMGRYERERIRTEDTQDRDSKRKGSITQRLDEHRKDEVKERDVLEIKEKNTENNRSKKLDKRENERNSRKGSLKLKEGVDKNKYLKHKSWATEVKRSMTKNKGSEKSKKITEEINSSRKTKEKMNVIQKDYDKHKKERGKSVLGESTFKQNLKDSKRENALFKNSGKVKNARNSEKKENKIGKSEKDEIIDKSKKIKNENKFGKANTLESEGEESIDKKSGNSNIYRGKINKIKKSEEKESINPKKGKERSYTKATANTKHISKPEQREKKMNDTGRKQIFQRFREVEDKQNIKMNKKQMNGKLRVKLKEENKANNEKQRIKILKNKNNKKYKGTILPAQDDIDGDRRIKLSTKTAKIYQKLAAEKRKKMTNTNKDRNDNSPMYQVSRCKATHILALNQPILFNTDGEKTARKCRVTFKGPPGSTLKVVCPVFNLAAKGCGAEKLHFKEPGFKKKFCKREEVLVETKGNILTILHSRKKHDKKHCPGVFVCQVVVATEKFTSSRPPVINTTIPFTSTSTLNSSSVSPTTTGRPSVTSTASDPPSSTTPDFPNKSSTTTEKFTSSRPPVINTTIPFTSTSTLNSSSVSPTTTGRPSVTSTASDPPSSTTPDFPNKSSTTTEKFTSSRPPVINTTIPFTSTSTLNSSSVSPTTTETTTQEPMIFSSLPSTTVTSPIIITIYKTTTFVPPSTTTSISLSPETVRTTINVSITTISSTTEMSVLPGPLFCHSCTRGHISLSRIIGGEIVDVGEFPWQVRLNIQPGIMCSGTLIGPSWVLTAAHCFPDGRLIETEVSLGDHDLGVVEPGSVVTRAKSVVVHQEFDSFSMNNDIAVLELQEPVTFTDRIKPICLATLEETPNNGLAVSSGWGHQSYGGSKSDILQKVTLDVITNEYCDTLYAGFYEITENMICTYTQNKDACQGDSGGPLVAQIGGYWKLIGTVSFGYRCAWKESPGIFARVAKYIDWIASHTYKETC
ncbi:uncharacterized protein LOC121858311 isoform X1 [Homarus americanus]|uniref:uncharacterized protein LOC121858311 isoform X1 n=1 Tax=Homarus americanus TaxID=6706 RepID=UPI001C452821|nr:uncharacterized protein LOC121858311 isoform X1 [Homarus americanus]